MKLRDYVMSGDKSKIIAVIRVLDKYQGKHFIYPLCKQIIDVSQGDKDIKNIVGVAMQQTGTVVGERGFIIVWEEKIKLLQDWLEDRSEFVREFAKELIDSLKSRIVEEEKKVIEFQARRKRRY